MTMDMKMVENLIQIRHKSNEKWLDFACALRACSLVL